MILPGQPLLHRTSTGMFILGVQVNAEAGAGGGACLQNGPEAPEGPPNENPTEDKLRHQEGSWGCK